MNIDRTAKFSFSFVSRISKSNVKNMTNTPSILGNGLCFDAKVPYTDQKKNGEVNISLYPSYLLTLAIAKKSIYLHDHIRQLNM